MTSSPAQTHARLQSRRMFSGIKNNPWALTATLAALLLALPLLAVVWIAFSGTESIWPHLVATVLPRAMTNTLLLLVGASVLALTIGSATAWLVTMFRFPGRALADRMLVMPLAIPVYIVAYAYVDLFDYAGPLQTALRNTFGSKSFVLSLIPDVRSLSGAIPIFAFALYPYVYLTARASFIQQSVCALEVARTLGRTPSGTFFSVALPMARPALIAGVTLVIMECLNDLGAVQYLGVETLSASIYATWMQRSNLPGAAQLSVVLLAMVAVLIIGERKARGGAKFHQTTGRFRAIPFETLTGWRAIFAAATVTVPVVLGFLLPLSVLGWRAIHHLPEADLTGFYRAAQNSLLLSALVSCVAVALALFFAYAARHHKSPATELAARISSLGYALPGTVLAIGLLSPLAFLDNSIDAWTRSTFGISVGLMLSGSLFAVTLALAIRFLAVSLSTVESGLERISPNIDAAARTLGAGSVSALRHIHLPLLRPAIGAAALLVFVDAMKELPATLLLRPFNFETLATWIYALTAAEQLEEAAIGAVAIIAIGMIPVLLLHRAIATGRSGASDQ